MSFLLVTGYAIGEKSVCSLVSHISTSLDTGIPIEVSMQSCYIPSTAPLLVCLEGCLTGHWGGGGQVTLFGNRFRAVTSSCGPASHRRS